MNLIDLIPGGRTVQLIVVAIVAAAVIGGVTWGVHSYNDSLRQEGRDEVQHEWDAERKVLEEQVEAQRARNRDMQRPAELHYTVQAEVRDRFITNTVTEVRYATQPISSCTVPADAVRLLNDAGHCAGTDRPAACGAGDAVRSPG